MNRMEDMHFKRTSDNCCCQSQEQFELRTVSENGGRVKSSQGVTVLVDHSFEDCPALDVLLVPGTLSRSFAFAKRISRCRT